VEWTAFETAAAEAATAAGQLIRPWAGRAPGVAAKGHPADLVTECDRRSEALIADLLRPRFPDHGFVGEEGGGRAEAEYVWHVDPIDGTTNFVHGLPGFCVSIGLCRAGRPIAGAVYDPVAGELFSASAGAGARVNGQLLRVAGQAAVAEALIGTGIPPVEPPRDWALRSLVAVAGRARNVRNLGSAALQLCYVAAGRLSGFWEPSLRSWDVAASVVILREAGGRATALDGEEWHAGLRGCAGTNGAIHDELLGILAGVPGPQASAD